MNKEKLKKELELMENAINKVSKEEEDLFKKISVMSEDDEIKLRKLLSKNAGYYIRSSFFHTIDMTTPAYLIYDFNVEIGVKDEDGGINFKEDFNDYIQIRYLYGTDRGFWGEPDCYFAKGVPEEVQKFAKEYAKKAIKSDGAKKLIMLYIKSVILTEMERNIYGIKGRMEFLNHLSKNFIENKELKKELEEELKNNKLLELAIKVFKDFAEEE